MVLCDHCAEDTDLIIYAYYDLCLCPTCQSKFERKEKYEKESLWELAKQQEHLESYALNYVYQEE